MEEFVLAGSACLHFSSFAACVSASGVVCTSCGVGYFLSDGRCVEDTDNTRGCIRIFACAIILAVVLVAVVLMLTGIVTIVIGLFRVIRCGPVPPFLFGTVTADAIWFLVLSCCRPATDAQA